MVIHVQIGVATRYTIRELGCSEVECLQTLIRMGAYPVKHCYIMYNYHIVIFIILACVKVHSIVQYYTETLHILASNYIR